MKAEWLARRDEGKDDSFVHCSLLHFLWNSLYDFFFIVFQIREPQILLLRNFPSSNLSHFPMKSDKTPPITVKKRPMREIKFRMEECSKIYRDSIERGLDWRIRKSFLVFVSARHVGLVVFEKWVTGSSKLNR